MHGTAAALDHPYDALEPLPREVWLPALVSSVGESQARLHHAAAWLAALQAGELPLATLDFGDAQALAPLRLAVGELALPAFAAGVPSAAQQVLRTALWHLDRLVDRPVTTSRETAIADMAAAFRAEWLEQRSGWEDILALLLEEAAREQRSIAMTVNMVLRRHYEGTGELDPRFKPRQKGQAA